jgi:predicted RNase H-like HicB family nuclease/DNA-binding transcriptional MerR regulator
MSGTGFGAKVAREVTGITYRQLDYWARTALVGSSIRKASGRGSRRVYSFEDLVALRVVAGLLGAGVSLKTVRRAVGYLQRHTDRPLSTLALIPKARSVFVLTEDRSKMIEASSHGQVVITIEVEPIVKTLRAEVTEIGAPRKIDVRVRGRVFEAVCTPDLEAGGYAVAVPELPGCLTEGDSIPEARRMVREAIGLWLDADSAPRRKGRARVAG